MRRRPRRRSRRAAGGAASREIAARFAALVLTDPHNVRYATGARNMMPFVLRNPARYVFVPLEGPVVLFEFAGCEHLERDNPAIDDIRVSTTVSYVARGPLLDETARVWAGEIAALMRQHCPGEARIGLERIDARAVGYLVEQGFTILDAQAPAERARSIKTPEEIACSKRSMACVMAAEKALEEAIRPGITENALWAEFHRHVIANDGDYVETRLLSSGERTNPWFRRPPARNRAATWLPDPRLIGRTPTTPISHALLCGEGADGSTNALRSPRHQDISADKPGRFRERKRPEMPA